jgi:hypothetical protein
MWTGCSLSLSVKSFPDFVHREMIAAFRATIGQSAGTLKESDTVTAFFAFNSSESSMIVDQALLKGLKFEVNLEEFSLFRLVKAVQRLAFFQCSPIPSRWRCRQV